MTNVKNSKMMLHLIDLKNKFYFNLNHQLIRVQSPEGTKRIEVNKESLSSLYDKIIKEFNIDSSKINEWGLYLDRNRSNHIPNTKNTQASEIISYGDMIYLLPVQSQKNQQTSVDVEEDEVDKELQKLDGKISRNRDEQMLV